ncbi:MAG: hypothetical protein ACLQQ4_15900 [Bacteroidia bacterium]
MAGITQTLIRQLADSNLLKRFNTMERSLLQNTEGKKIYDCTDNEIKQALAYCCIMVGIDRPPGDDKKMVLVSFLRKYHGALTNKQVAQAFELVATGELGADLQEHYNNISPMYLSKVIRAYMQKLNGVKYRYEFKKRSDPVQKSSPEGYYKRLVKVIEEYNIIPAFWAWDEVYEYLGQNNPGLSLDVSLENKKEAVVKFFREKYPNARQQMLNI